MKTLGVFITLLILSACQAGRGNMNNLEIIKSTYQGKTSQENSENLMASLGEKVIWIEADGFPLAGTYIGKQAIIDGVFTQLSKQWANYQIEVEQYVAQDDNVIALGSYSGIYKKTGIAFQARVAHHWQLKNGKVTRFEQFVDSVPIVRAMQTDIALEY